MKNLYKITRTDPDVFPYIYAQSPPEVVNSFHASYKHTEGSQEKSGPVCENTTGYLKNHWTKHRLVCTHFNAFSMLILNMDAKCNNFEI